MLFSIPAVRANVASLVMVDGANQRHRHQSARRERRLRTGRKRRPVPVVWASGSNGVILKSLDRGKTWQRLHVAGGDALDFRGIVAFNARTRLT